MLRLDAIGSAPEVTQRMASDRALREKASEFEGMLIAQILQKLDECYKLGNSDEDDSTSESFQSLATSAVSGGLARSGGLGIGEMIVRSLTGEAKNKEDVDSKGS